MLFQTIKYKGWIPSDILFPVHNSILIFLLVLIVGNFSYITIIYLTSNAIDFYTWLFSIICCCFGVVLTWVVPRLLFRKHREEYVKSR